GPSSAPVTGATRWYVVKQVRLGTLDARGQSTPFAWKTIGFDRDGRDTTADDSKGSVGTCARVSGAATGTLIDGCGGIDNAFGEHLMQTVRSFEPSLESETNLGASMGEENFLLRIEGVDDGDNSNAPGAFYRTAPLANSQSPPFDGTDQWSIVSDSLVDCGSLDQPIVRFPDGYIAQGMWVSGLATTSFEIPLRIYY